MFRFQRLYLFSKTRFGQNLLGTVAVLAGIAALTAICLPRYNRSLAIVRESHENGANGRAIQEALGLRYTALVDEMGDTYVYRGTGILFVKPGGPFDKAGFKRNDRIRLNLGTVKTLLIQQKGKTVVLPVERAGHRFDVTVNVPNFTVPYPELVPLPRAGIYH